jgi:hypothetical protein
MILISLEEKKTVLEKYPDVHIVRTMKHDSKRHRYYMVEDPGPMRVIKQMRGEWVDKPRRSRNNRNQRPQKVQHDHR